MYLKETITLVVVQLCVFTFSANFPSNTGENDALVAQGRMQYQIMKVESKMPRYGDCWKNALLALDEGCANLDDETQSRLALKFANCFLQKSGMKRYECDPDTRISTCLENVESNGFTAYTNFFTHTHSMCYFLQSQIWHEETGRTVERLVVNSDKVSESLQASHDLQTSILHGQEKTLEYNRQLAENGSYLSRAIEVSKENVRDMLEEFRTSTHEQKTMIFEVFDRLASLQNIVLSEVNWLYTIVFYGTSLLVIYIVTATKRTADARLVLFILLTVNLGVERFLCWVSLPLNGEKIPLDLADTIHQRVWMAREAAMGVGVVILTIVAVRFKDYNIINNTLLQEIRKQNLDLKRSMEAFQVGNKMRYQGDAVDSGLTAALPIAVQSWLNEDTGFQGDEEEEVSDTESESFNSTRTDITFDPFMSSGDRGEDVFNTAENSRENSGNITPTNVDIGVCGDESLSNSVLAVSCQSLQSLLFTPKRGRPRGSRTSTPTPDREKYNLRSRRSEGVNPLLTAESPETFALTVKKHLKKTQRNYSKWQQAVNKQNLTGYSSDE